MARRVARRADRWSRVTATTAKNEFARVLDTALQRGEVVITKHDAPRAVLVSIEKYNQLAGQRALDELQAEFDDMLATMQSDRSRKAARRAFDATPAELGKAAVAASRKR